MKKIGRRNRDADILDPQILPSEKLDTVVNRDLDAARPLDFWQQFLVAPPNPPDIRTFTCAIVAQKSSELVSVANQRQAGRPDRWLHGGIVIIGSQIDEHMEDDAGYPKRYLYENLPKASGYFRQYSRFWETSGGDFLESTARLRW